MEILLKKHEQICLDSIIWLTKKLLELGLLKSEEAFKAQYYSYIMNGLITQLARIKPNKQIEEAHMQNRALIAWWAYSR